MKKIFTFLIICISGIFTHEMFAGLNGVDSLATSTNDSIGNEKVTDLQEFVVKADNAYFKEGVLTVIPTKKEKEAAFDGNELLRFLQIPTLIYDYEKKQINHISGSLALYINGEPANDVEIQNLKATDVTRVEYMDFPTDPRYGQNPHVVNFVVRKYLYGGYTRVKSEEYLRLFSNNSTLYSKFSVNNLCFDAYVSYLGGTSKLEKDTSIKTYRFDDSNESSAFLREESQLLNGTSRSNLVPVSLRIVYSKPTYTISNTIGYTFSGTPEELYKYRTAYSGIYNSETLSSVNEHSHSNDVSWAGRYRFFLPKNWYLQVSPTLSYSRMNSRIQTSSGLDNLDEIVYQNRENNYLASLAVHANKRFNNAHGMYILASIGHSWYDISYYGTTKSESNEKLLFLNCVLGYSYRFGPLSLMVSGGYTFNRSLSGISERNESSPFFGINAYYSPTEKHSFSLGADFNNQNPHPSELASDIIQVNNFLYVTGDPKGKGTKALNAQFSWTWLPSNMIRIGVSGYYVGKYNRMVPVYTSYAGGTALLRKVVNSGNRHCGDIYFNFGLNNIANCLSITLGPSLNIYNETGIYKKTLVYLDYRASLDCILKNGFSLYAAFYGPRKSYRTGTTTNSSFDYNIGGQWSWKGLKVRLDLRNIFGGPDWTMKKSFENTYYSTSNILESKGHLYSVSLTLSYTFSYGKKRTDVPDEINAIQGVGSGAIGL